MVGSGSKLGREYPVTAYRLGGRVTLEKLLEFIPDSNGEQQRLLGLMRKGGSRWPRRRRNTRIGMSGGSSRRSGGAAGRSSGISMTGGCTVLPMKSGLATVSTVL